MDRKNKFSIKNPHRISSITKVMKDHQLKEPIHASEFHKYPAFFYPGAFEDTTGVDIFVNKGKVSVGIMVDYISDAKILNNVIHRVIDTGWAIAERYPLEPEFFGKSGWREFWSDKSCIMQSFQERAYQDYGDATLFKGTKYFNEDSYFLLLYFRTEAIQTYLNLFGHHNKAPEVIILQDHGFGGFWTDFCGKTSLLHQSCPTLPPYIMVAEGCDVWEGYEAISPPIHCPKSMHESNRILYKRVIDKKNSIAMKRQRWLEFFEPFSSPTVNSNVPYYV